MPVYTNFKGVTEFYHPELSEQISNNLISYLNWSFLQIGAFSNIEIPTSGAYGGDFSRLTPLINPYYTDGQVWQGIHDQWVYESGLDRDIQPINFSGVYVDGTFYPKDTNGAYEHYVDYTEGQIVFTNPISLSSSVAAEYSFREVSILDCESVPFFQKFDYHSYRPDTAQRNLAGSGDLDIFGEMRISLPCVGIEVFSRDSEPHGLGGSCQRAHIGINFHVFAEHKPIANRIAEIIKKQEEKSIYLYDMLAMINNGSFPLDYRGSTHSGTLMYPDLVETYMWRKLRFNEANTQLANKIQQNLYQAITKVEAEVIVSNI